MFYLFLQSSSVSRQPKFSNLMVFANHVYRVRSYSSASHLGTFQWHGRTRSSNNSIFLFEIRQFFLGKYTTFNQSSSASRKWKNSNVVRFAGPVHRVRRDPSMTLSPDTTRYSLRITKFRQSDIFPYFSLENTNFFWKIFYIYLESSSASRKWKNRNVVLFAVCVYRKRRDPSVRLKKNFSTDSTRQNSKYSKETVKWRMANVFTVKQLTMCPGWLLRKTILKGFQ